VTGLAVDALLEALGVAELPPVPDEVHDGKPAVLPEDLAPLTDDDSLWQRAEPFVRRVISEPSGADRSRQTWHTVNLLLECGYSNEDAAKLMTRHAPSIDKGRFEQLVAKAIGKARSRHDHAGRACNAAGCTNKPNWQADALYEHTPDASPGPGSSARSKLTLPETWSDAHVGEAFGTTLTGRWVYCRALGGWLGWDGRRWAPDRGEAVHEEFRQWVIRIGEQVWRDAGDSDVMRQVAKYRERGKIDAAVIIARRLETVAATADEFDRHPHLLNVGNGVVDLRTGELLPHDPTLRLTKLTTTTYIPGTTHPDFDAVLDALTGDTRLWVQRLFGAAAYGSVVDDVLPVFDGTGGNGKTTLLKVIAGALGEYAVPASTRLLMARGVTDEHPTLIADLYGRRLVYIEETPEGGALKMEQVKALTGGGRLSARFIGKDYFDFEPSHTIVVATNHRPAVNASDYAAWRRLRLVPFTRTYVAAHEAKPGDLIADRQLRARLDRPHQREAALAWIIAGATGWHADGGLGACTTIDEATATWRRDEDVIHAWFADCARIGGDTRASDLYRSFADWCTREGRRYVSSNKEFVKRFTDHDLYRNHAITKRVASNGTWYSGLTVVDVVGSSPGSREGVL